MPKIAWNRSWAFNWKRRNAQITGIWPSYRGNCDWRPIYVVWPRKTITGRWAFMEQIYYRVLWVEWDHSLGIDREVQYADTFGVMTDPYGELISQAVHAAK